MSPSLSGSSSSTPKNAGKPVVLVLGCGWLGLALARSLVAAGSRVLGTTTTPEQLGILQDAKIEGHLLRLGSNFAPADEVRLMKLLRTADVLVLNVPPRAATAGGYPTLLRPVHRAVAAGSVRVTSGSTMPCAGRM